MSRLVSVVVEEFGPALAANNPHCRVMQQSVSEPQMGKL
jgi:hypothetical protein